MQCPSPFVLGFAFGCHCHNTVLLVLWIPGSFWKRYTYWIPSLSKKWAKSSTGYQCWQTWAHFMKHWVKLFLCTGNNAAMMSLTLLMLQQAEEKLKGTHTVAALSFASSLQLLWSFSFYKRIFFILLIRFCCFDSFTYSSSETGRSSLVFCWVFHHKFLLGLLACPRARSCFPISNHISSCREHRQVFLLQGMFLSSSSADMWGVTWLHKPQGHDSSQQTTALGPSSGGSDSKGSRASEQGLLLPMWLAAHRADKLITAALPYTQFGLLHIRFRIHFLRWYSYAWNLRTAILLFLVDREIYAFLFKMMKMLLVWNSWNNSGSAQDFSQHLLFDKLSISVKPQQ